MASRNIYFKGNDVYKNDVPLDLSSNVRDEIINTFDFESALAGSALTVSHDLNTEDVFVYARDLKDRELILPDVVVNNFSEVSVTFAEGHSKVRANVIEILSNKVFGKSTISSAVTVDVQHNLDDSNVFVFCKDNDTGDLFLPNVSTITPSHVGVQFDSNYNSVNVNFLTRDTFNDYREISANVGSSGELDYYHGLNNVDHFTWAVIGDSIISPGVSSVAADSVKLKFDQAYSGINIITGGWGNARENGQVIKTGNGRERGLFLLDSGGSEWLMTVNSSGVLSTTQIV